ncbi:sialic acid-binding Ig-like lectin 12 isoform X1 [Bufo bufo]|uniref:sialic acid-binding Ig-like lectin 12 isoform X1 n=1 Tax=Bufo bufo TaxID=8384 RepID=UPI001ABE0C68|nr:sialic acid-binding Ig-like lectin 12 isoform X1 [Bufo bufo]
MTHRSICNLWILLAAITLSQLWRGITGQVQSYSIEVVSSVRVQEGHNASIPCNFTAGGRNTFSNSFGYWRELYSESIIATNDKSRAGQQRNFHLKGNPDSGDCTLTITDARREDDTEYYFRFEESKDSNVKYSYKDKKIHIIVTGIKEKIVFSKGYSIEVNSSVSVQKGLSVSIPCKFTAADSNTFRNSFGYWRELYSESIVATNDDSSAVQKTNFKLTGNPDSGDCTLTITDARREDEGVYYFRFQESKDGKVKYDYYKEVTTTIKVTGLTPQVVHIPYYSITVASSVEVQEGLCVTIPCNFTADSRNSFSDSFGYWMRMPKQPTYVVATNDKSSTVQNKNFNLMGNPDSGDCTLTITDASREDEGEYYYRFQESKDSKVKYNYYKVTTAIKVTDLTEEPVISDVGSLIAGVNKTVTCAPPRNCPGNSLAFQWKKSNVAGIWKNSSTITFTPSIEDDQETITCEMTNSRRNTTQKHIHLDFDCLT